MELKIGEHEYQIGQLDVFSQFHVARRLIPALIAFSKAGGEEDLGDILEPVVMEICKMSDADANYLLETCLSAVFRKDKVGWVKIKPAGSTAMQYQDIDLVVVIQLVIQVVKENLGDFFITAPSIMGAGLDQE